MLIRSYDTSLALSPAPKFGLDGSWPPVETEWLPVRWELFEAQAPAADFGSIVAHALALAPGGGPLPADAPVLTKDALDDDFLYEEVFAHVSNVMVKTSIAGRNIEIVIESGRDWRSGQKDPLYLFQCHNRS